MTGTPLLCRLGFHRWGKKHGFNQYSSNIIDWSCRCERCGKINRWIETKPVRKQ
jgi:hypothetical protein